MCLSCGYSGLHWHKEGCNRPNHYSHRNDSARLADVVPVWFVLAVLVLASSFRAPSVAARYSAHFGERDGSEIQSIAQMVTQLSLEDKIGQILQIRVYGDYPDFNDPAYRVVRDQIAKYHVGSVDLGARMVGPNLVKGSPARVAEILNQLQRDSRLPLLVAADLERGLASRVSGVPQFPFPMAFGAANDVASVERFGEVTGEEGRAIGIHWAFAPVADVNSNPENPFSERPVRNNSVSRVCPATV